MTYTSLDISLDVFTSNIAVGSPTGGCDYDLVGCEHHSLQQLSLVIGEEGFERIMAKKHNGTSISVGVTDSKPSINWKFGLDEKFLSINLYSSEDHLAGIEITTDKGQKLKAYLPGYSPSHPIVIPVGSGKCLGIFGNSGTIVDSLGFAMLNIRKKQ